MIVWEGWRQSALTYFHCQLQNFNHNDIQFFPLIIFIKSHRQNILNFYPKIHISLFPYHILSTFMKHKYFIIKVLVVVQAINSNRQHSYNKILNISLYSNISSIPVLHCVISMNSTISRSMCRWLWLLSSRISDCRLLEVGADLCRPLLSFFGFVALSQYRRLVQKTCSKLHDRSVLKSSSTSFCFSQELQLVQPFNILQKGPICQHKQT